MTFFDRNYELIITLTTGEAIIINSDLRIGFEVDKSIYKGLNTCKIQIYNLNQQHRDALVKDKEDGKKRMPFRLSIGYAGSIKKIFQGTVWEAMSEKKGVDFITTISSQDGGYDYTNSFTSKTVKGKQSEAVISDMKNTKLGKISTQPSLSRPKVLIGNSFQILEESLAEDETLFVDNETIYIIKRDEVTNDFIPLITSSSGLLNIPTRSNNQVNFKSLINPDIRIGGLVALESQYAKYLNGVYKCETIKYKGDNFGNDWTMEIVGMRVNNYKVLK